MKGVAASQAQAPSATLTLAFLAGLAALFLSACGENTSSSTSSENEPHTKAESAFASMGPSQHLAEVQRLFGEAQTPHISPEGVSLRLSEAREHTEAIPANLPEHRQASSIVSSISDLLGRTQDGQAAANRARDEAARQDYARRLEGHLLSQGIDATVRAVGEEQRTLRISWAAMSRPIVYNMINGSGLNQQVPSLGFRKVIFTDDGSFSGLSTDSWTYVWNGGTWLQH